jgi:hypothetical protein
MLKNHHSSTIPDIQFLKQLLTPSMVFSTLVWRAIIALLNLLRFVLRHAVCFSRAYEHATFHGELSTVMFGFFQSISHKTIAFSGITEHFQALGPSQIDFSIDLKLITGSKCKKSKTQSRT